jgi:hypothetical protein
MAAYRDQSAYRGGLGGLGGLGGGSGLGYPVGRGEGMGFKGTPRTDSVGHGMDMNILTTL